MLSKYTHTRWRWPGVPEIDSAVSPDSAAFRAGVSSRPDASALEHAADAGLHWIWLVALPIQQSLIRAGVTQARGAGVCGRQWGRSP